MPCSTKFRIYEPLEAYRKVCPKIFITSYGVHTHPIPLPLKTPSVVRKQIAELLVDLTEDLADLTPRRFLRHPIVNSYLRARFPDLPSPNLSDLHVSLANRSHLKAYIQLAKEQYFPAGTGWEGRLIRIRTVYLSLSLFPGFLDRYH